MATKSRKADPYSVRKIINGIEYTAQFSGLSLAYRAVDSSYVDDSKNTSVEKFTQFILDNVIVDPPGLTIDDFDDQEELKEVTTFGREVMQGEHKQFRTSGLPDKKSKTRKSEEDVESVPPDTQ